MRGHISAAAAFPAELRLRRAVAVRRPLYQVELQRGERRPVYELPGGAGGDLAATG